MTRALLVVMDPPWSADAGGGKIKRGADAHYSLSAPAGIAQVVRTSPCWRDDGPALVWMWATVGALHKGHAHQLASALSLEVCAGFVWCKVDEVDADRLTTWAAATVPLEVPVPQQGALIEATRLAARAMLDGAAAANKRVFTQARMGLGQWTRCEHEHLLICRRGDVKVPEPPARLRSVIYDERGIHSAKPEAAWETIESVSASALRDYADVDAVEIFAREARHGWAAFGTLDGPDKPARFQPAQPLTTWRA